MSKAKSKAARLRWKGFTEDFRKKIAQNQSKSMKSYWNSLTLEERRERGRKIAEGKRLKRLLKEKNPNE